MTLNYDISSKAETYILNIIKRCRLIAKDLLHEDVKNDKFFIEQKHPVDLTTVLDEMVNKGILTDATNPELSSNVFRESLGSTWRRRDW